MISIVGAGPAGLAAALFLNLYGLPVHIHEAKNKGRHKVCGGFLNANALPLLDLIRADSVFEFVSKEVIEHFCLSTSQTSAVWTIPGKVYSLSRQELDLRLWELCESRGITFSSSESIKEVIPDGHQVILRSASARYTSDYVVCADGLNSIAHDNSCKKPELRKRIGIQYLIKTEDMPTGQLCLYFTRFGYLGSCAYRKDHFDFSAIVDLEKIPQEQRHPESILQEFIAQDRLLRRNLKHYELIEAPKVVAQTIPHHESFESERILLAGDAKRFLEPFTGLGITYALATGMMAASRIMAHGHPEKKVREEMSRLYRFIERGITSLIAGNLLLAPVLMKPKVACLGVNLLARVKFPVNLMLQQLMKPVFKS